MKKRNEIKPKTHKILNHPYLSLILLPLWCMLISTIIGGVLDGILTAATPMLRGLGTVAAALICLSIHMGWFRGEFDGNLKIKNTGKGLLLLSPLAIYLIANLTEASFSAFTPAFVITALCSAAAPGVLEEVAFRGLAGSNFMRLWKDEKKIRRAAVLTALVFGLVHMANIFSGAGVASSVNQAVYTFGSGIMLAAVYFRTGSLLPSIIFHILLDTTAFLSLELQNSGGVLTDEGFQWIMLITGATGIAFGVLGLYYLRSEKIPDIVALWNEKWKVLPAAEAGEAPAAEAGQESAGAPEEKPAE